MTWAGSEYPWSSWRTLVPIVIGSIGIITTLIWERYAARKPFLRLELFLHGLSAGPMDIAYIHGKVHAIGGYLPMRWVEYDLEEVPISMDKYSIHGCG